MKYGGNLSFKVTLNRIGNTPDNFKFLLYELGNIAGLSETAYRNLLKQPLLKEIIHEARKLPPVNDLTPQMVFDTIEVQDISKLNWKNLQEVFKVSGLKVKPRSKVKI